jgi:peptidoglycan hydrolase-like protein with peptidoglycan-binding domain
MDGNLALDGCYGAKTEALCEKYQKKYGLKVDGSFGKESLAKAKTIKK